MEGFKKVLKEWIIPFALEILVVLLLIKFVFFFAWVPSGSMEPTIDTHSWLFATRMYNPEKNVGRGDILVFRSDEEDENMIKRCIGLPGDHILLDEEGRLYVNGEFLEEPYVVNQDDTSGEWQVPEGCYFFMGDNRSGSFDARFWDQSFIPGDKILGKARFTMLPLRNFGVLK